MTTLIALRRVEKVIDDYTMAWQSGYKHGRSCSDIVWAQRMLISVVMRKNWSFCKLGIDMSRAFDTVKRDVIIKVLKDAGASEDDVRILQYLLSNTKLRVRVNSTFSEVFETLLGAFQGDSLSGKLFTLISNISCSSPPPTWHVLSQIVQTLLYHLLTSPWKWHYMLMTTTS